MEINNDMAYLKGQFIVAMPALNEPNFFQTVICISEHNSDGAVGIVVNRVQFGLFGKMIFDELKMDYIPEAGNIKIHLGGPVHTGEIFVLHGPPFEWASCFMITPYLAMSNSRDILDAIAMGRGPESYIISLGCAGWGPEQLEAEIMTNSWLTCPVYEDIIFDIQVDNRWNETVKKMGIEPFLLSDTAGHA